MVLGSSSMLSVLVMLGPLFVLGKRSLVEIADEASLENKPELSGIKGQVFSETGVSFVSKDTDEQSSRLDDVREEHMENLTGEAYPWEDTPNPDGHPFDGFALKCYVRGTHTYLNINDGGCFPHVDENGGVSDKAAYERKRCPFVGDSATNIKRRSWLKLYETKAGVLRAPQFAVNDLAMVCIKESLNMVHKFANSIGVALKDSDDPEFFCDTFLSLPLMFEGIGFDVSGLVWEIGGQQTTLSYFGFPAPYPTPRVWKNPKLCKRIGKSENARLALRAMLPTYYLHSYTNSWWGMVKKGGRQILFKKFYEKWKARNLFVEPLREVLGAVQRDPVGDTSNMDNLLLRARLRQNAMLSQEVLQRDKGVCQEVASCGYGDQKLSDCSLCSQKGCLRSGLLGSSGKCIPCVRPKNCTSAQKKERCECHKAICWFLTHDFLNVIRDPVFEKPVVKGAKWRVLMDKKTNRPVKFTQETIL